jgi:uncharacterized protein (TIGR03083 family)
MTTLTDRIIAVLEAQRESLEALVEGLTDEQLTSPSGASEWTLADVLSHLGSGAELSIHTLSAAVSGVPAPERDNQVVWDRWNSLPPREQAAGFLDQNGRLMATLSGLTAQQRESLRVDLPFLPAPVPPSTVAGMRLNEIAQHGWDVRVGLDPAATLDAEAAEILLELYAGELGFMLGFIGKAEAAASPAEVAIGDYALVIDESASLGVGSQAPTAKFEGPSEAAIRLLGGRLAPESTPDGVRVTGNISLDDLRRVFPGY